MSRITKAHAESIRWLEQRMEQALSLGNEAARQTESISPSPLSFTRALVEYERALNLALALIVLHEGFGDTRTSMQAKDRYTPRYDEAYSKAQRVRREIERRLPATRAVSW